MSIRRRSAGRTRAFARLVALIVLVFTASACGQTDTTPEQNPNDAPPANAPEGNNPAAEQADDQGDDQSDNQDDQGND